MESPALDTCHGGEPSLPVDDADELTRHRLDRAIQGDDLYFGASPGGAKGPFRTSPAGDVVLATPLSTGLSERAELMACPAALPSFPDMSLVVCYAAQDAGGRPLNLAWDAGCP